MWLPCAQMLAKPSQPLLPYLLLHTSTRPDTGLQFFGFVLPATIVVSNTVETLQSVDEAARYASQLDVTSLPSFSVNGLDVRAQ